jgi:hypothetical protein
MAKVSSYHILFYGDPAGNQMNPAQIQLSNASGQALAWVRPNDPGMSFGSDYESAGI